MTLGRGTLLHKRYRIEDILGQGGMGSVYRAVDENLGLDVAVKENMFTTDEYARQFRLEAVILANLRHPNLPRVSDHFVIAEQGQYLVMDFIEGEDLRQRMERSGTISEEDAVRIGAAICDALEYLHTRKPVILHRDLKPGNVKIAPDGQIFLVDFGLAKIVQGSQVTTTGARAMTPGYSPPEQYGTARTDARTDIYSLGATLYAALTGIIPEDGLARAMDNADLTPLRRRNSRVSRRLSAAIEKAMSVDPADRYQTAEEFKKALLSSKSITEQQTGRYNVAPPPPEALEAARLRSEAQTDADAPKASIPRPSMVEEEKPFVPPGKILLEKQRRQVRRRRSLLLFLLLAAAALVGVLYYNPWMVPAEARSLITMLVNTATALATTTPTQVPATPQPSATAQPSPSPTATRPPPTATRTRAPVPSPARTEPVLPAATGQPTWTASPTVTPVGGGQGQLAFASSRSGTPQIYLTDLLGGHVQAITDLADGACQPTWSPDGSQLVFVSPCSGPEQVSQNPRRDTGLYLINADGTGLSALTTVPGGDFEPAWSPDGKQIAFTSLRDGGMQIYVLDLAQRTVTRLSHLGGTTEARQPAWLPSGDTIVFAARRMGAYQIWSMSASGEDARQIIRSGEAYWDFFPEPSGDGSAILFSQQAANGVPAAWQMSSPYRQEGTTTAVRMELGGLPAAHAAVSPDGYWVAFQSQAGEQESDLYLVMVTGAGISRLTQAPGLDFDPAWRPGLRPGT